MLEETAPRRTVTVYRGGTRYRTAPWREASREAEPLVLALRPAVWTQEGPSGEVLFFSHERTVGVGVQTALALGMCEVREGSRVAERSRSREHRAVEQELTSLLLERLLVAITTAALAGDPLARTVLGADRAETLEALTEHFEAAAREFQR